MIAAGARRLDVDHLRSAAVLLLLVFHTARLFDAEDWHIKDAGRYLAADLVVRALNLVQMPLLFLLAGVAMAFSGATRSSGAFVAERLARLLLPLAAGCGLVVLPQVWIERRAHGAPGRYSPLDFDGSLADFAPHFLECCYPQANSSWHHLWFLAYLLAYSLAMLPLLALARHPAAAAALARAAARVDSVPRWLLLGLPLLGAELLLRPAFPSTHALLDDWANHAHFGALLLLGWGLAHSERPFAAAAAAAPRLAAAALVLGLLWLGLPGWAGALPAPGRGVVAPVLRVAGEWTAIVALLGLARRYLARPGRLTPFGRYAMPFYVIHQALIVALGAWWLGWESQPVLKFVAIAGAAGVGTMALCLAAERLSITRRLLGMKAAAGAHASGARPSAVASTGRTG